MPVQSNVCTVQLVLSTIDSSKPLPRQALNPMAFSHIPCNTAVCLPLVVASHRDDHAGVRHVRDTAGALLVVACAAAATGGLNGQEGHGRKVSHHRQKPLTACRLERLAPTHQIGTTNPAFTRTVVVHAMRGLMHPPLRDRNSSSSSQCATLGLDSTGADPVAP